MRFLRNSVTAQKINNRMPANIKDVLENIKDIYMTDSSLSTLLDYERVLDELDLYSFSNWKKGELIEGPIYEKYFVTCSWMFPFREMPDPSGAERLLNYGCEVTFKRDKFVYPIKVKSPDDYKPGTKSPRMVERPIWVVTITIPKKLMSDIEQGSIELEGETLDQEDIEQAYETGADEDVYKTSDEQQNAQAQPEQLPAV
jgi:hypothetical protein